MSLDHLNQSEPVQQPEKNTQELYHSFEEVNAPEFDDAPRKMSPLLFYLVVASIVAVVLLCVTLGFKLLAGDEEPSSEESTDNTTSDTTDDEDITEDSTITLLKKKDNGKTILKKIDFQNKEGSFTIYQNDKDGKFLLKGYEDILLSKDMVSLMKEHTTTITATGQIKNPGALKDYGLDAPSATAVITYTDGSTSTLKLGDELPTGDGYYGTLDSKEGIYLFSADNVTLFRLQPVAFADTTLISTSAVKSGDTNGNALLKEIRYTGKAFSRPMVVRRSNHLDSEELQLFTYVISEPFLRGVTDIAAGYFGNLKSLSATQALYLHPTEAQKEKLGFNDPLTTLLITTAVETSEGEDTNSPNTYYGEKQFELTIGSKDNDGNYRVMLKSIDAIFMLEAASFADIAERTYANTVNELLFLKNIDQISRISIEINGKVHEFELKHYPNAEDLDDQLKVVCDGKTLSTTNFRELYLLLLGLNRYDYLDKAPEGTPEMVIKLYDADGKYYMGATYTNMSGTFCAVETTEGEIFTTRWRNISHFINQVANLLNGEKVNGLTY